MMDFRFNRREKSRHRGFVGLTQGRVHLLNSIVNDGTVQIVFNITLIEVSHQNVDKCMGFESHNSQICDNCSATLRYGIHALPLDYFL